MFLRLYVNACVWMSFDPASSGSSDPREERADRRKGSIAAGPWASPKTSSSWSEAPLEWRAARYSVRPMPQWSGYRPQDRPRPQEKPMQYRSGLPCLHPLHHSYSPRRQKIQNYSALPIANTTSPPPPKKFLQPLGTTAPEQYYKVNPKQTQNFGESAVQIESR